MTVTDTPTTDREAGRVTVLQASNVTMRFGGLTAVDDVSMTALENVMVGRYCRTSAMALTSILRGPKFRREEEATRERAQELLEYVGLGRSGELLARNMPYGDQRRLEIARALATDPQILLLDEPTAGMNPRETEETT